MSRRTQVMVTVAVAPVAYLFGYTFLHEGGHALVALAAGARIDSFTLGPNAHMSHSGGSFTTLTESLLHCAGVALPVLVLVGALLAYRRTSGSDVYHVLHAVLAVSITASVLPWVVIPVVALVGTAPAGDDVTHLIEASGVSPLVVAAVALATLGGLVALAVTRGLPQTVGRAMREVRARETTAQSQDQDASIVSTTGR